MILLWIGNRQARQLTWTGRLLIVLALSSLGCARGDWISETMTLVDLTGTWEGSFRFDQGGQERQERTIRFVLQQKGQKVRGDAQAPDGNRLGTVQGLVNGEVFSWQLTGSLRPGRDSSATYHSVVTINNSDALSGRADGAGCPCPFLLRRVNIEAIREKQSQ